MEEAASSTRAIIWDRVVSWPTWVARTVSTPAPLRQPDMTRSPSPLSTGMDSPVRGDSSTLDTPDTTTPSTGREEPGRMRSRSPTCTSWVGMVTSWPSRSTVAVLGLKSMSRAMAWPVLPLERASRNLPRVMRVTIMAADSKYKSMAYRSTRAVSPWPSPQPMAYRAAMP